MILVFGVTDLQLGCEAELKKNEEWSSVNSVLSFQRLDQQLTMSDSDQLMHDACCWELVLDYVWGWINAQLICVSAQAVFARGISAVWQNYICVGRYSIMHLITKFYVYYNIFLNSNNYVVFVTPGFSWFLRCFVLHFSLRLQGCRMVQF